MQKELELWQFIAGRLNHGQPVMLLVVAESSGSSPGRAGYKMAVGVDGELAGSIGGGVMEVDLVEQSRAILSEPGGSASFLKPQVHRKHAQNPSGMICSGEQTVIFRLLTPENTLVVDRVIKALEDRRKRVFLTITPTQFTVGPPKGGTANAAPLPEGATPNDGFQFIKLSDTEFAYEEKLGHKNNLYIVGGGHCALALSELMSKMDFYIRLFDDRPELNTLDKNRFAHEIEIISSYEQIGGFIPSGPNKYVVVMTLGYASDEIVIRGLLDKDFKYFGVLGSRAKMATLLKKLKNEGFSAEKLDTIHTPIGLLINSRTPEEIAVSIAAEIIALKNEKN